MSRRNRRSWSSWVKNLISGRQAPPARRAGLRVEQLESKTLLSASPIGPQFVVSPTLGPLESAPAIAVIDSGPGQGDFIAVWQSYGEDGDGYGVYAQVFDENGDAIPGEPAFLVNTTTV